MLNSLRVTQPTILNKLKHRQQTKKDHQLVSYFLSTNWHHLREEVSQPLCHLADASS